MKIYTKKGDKGTTALFGGKRLRKDDVRIEAYGTVDELNAYLGLLCEKIKHLDTAYDLLRTIQFDLFDIGAQLATDPEKRTQYNLPLPSEDKITTMEKHMDEMNERLPELKSFVIPGGNEAAGHCHVARTICRRAERRIVTLMDDGEVIVRMIKYINRLSDYLFVLSRFICQQSGDEEVLWKSSR